MKFNFIFTKPKIVTFSLAFLLFALNAQNVGIGTSKPTEKLDVNGNINLSGNLLINGTSGLPGQVLAMDGGTLRWMDKSRFKQTAIFRFQGPDIFTVPPGVTEILIEMWGAGGGGHSPGGGGGSGGYWIGNLAVEEGNVINLSIGSGGSAGSLSTDAGTGGNTSFSFGDFNVISEGGGGADSLLSGNVEFYRGGKGGAGLKNTSSVPFNYKSFFFIDGEYGVPTTIDYMETANGVFGKVVNYGTGGTAPYSGNLQAAPVRVVFSSNGSVLTRSHRKTIDSAPFGCGGTPLGISGGQAGGQGMIIIYF